MSSKLEQLEKLKKLLDEGGISKEEYDVLKQEIFSGEPEPRNTNTISSYVLKEQIGEGGQGSVYKGRHQLEAKAKQQGGDVAIKILHISNQNAFLRLQREASIGLELQHPNIARVFDFVKEGDRTGVVMEFVDGKTLLEYHLKVLVYN